MKYSQSPNNEWKKLVLTAEEAHEKMLREYHVDEETDEILGAKQTLIQRAIHNGIDTDPEINTWDYANELFEIMQAEREKGGLSR